jgi:hypothetical protein
VDCSGPAYRQAGSPVPLRLAWQAAYIFACRKAASPTLQTKELPQTSLWLAACSLKPISPLKTPISKIGFSFYLYDPLQPQTTDFHEVHSQL